MPMISVNHLAFTSPNAVSDLADDDLEKVIFPVVDAHI